MAVKDKKKDKKEKKKKLPLWSEPKSLDKVKH